MQNIYVWRQCSFYYRRGYGGFSAFAVADDVAEAEDLFRKKYGPHTGKSGYVPDQVTVPDPDLAYTLNFPTEKTAEILGGATDL